MFISAAVIISNNFQVSNTKSSIFKIVLNSKLDKQWKSPSSLSTRPYVTVEVCSYTAGKEFRGQLVWFVLIWLLSTIWIQVKQLRFWDRGDQKSIQMTGLSNSYKPLKKLFQNRRKLWWIARPNCSDPRVKNFKRKNVTCKVHLPKFKRAKTTFWRT